MRGVKNNIKVKAADEYRTEILNIFIVQCAPTRCSSNGQNQSDREMEFERLTGFSDERKSAFNDELDL